MSLFVRKNLVWLGFAGMFLGAGLSLNGCGKETTKEVVKAEAPKGEPSSQNNSNQVEQFDLKNTDLLKISKPCKEDEENLGRIIRVDNEPVAQFCKNRKWGNPYVDGSSFKCGIVGFDPVLTEDKRGVSCRNAQKVVSLNTRWYPSGQGLEMCNPEEADHWLDARDSEGRKFYLRCDENRFLNADKAKSRFWCNDPNLNFKTRLFENGQGVACINDKGIYSLSTIEEDNYLKNSNCTAPGKWELVMDRGGEVKASKCDSWELPAPGYFLNLDNLYTCSEGKVPKLFEEQSRVECVEAE